MVRSRLSIKSVNALFAVLALLSATCIFIALTASPSAAEAFDVEFPADNYLQLESPSFLSAADGKLAVYDKVKNTVFIKSTERVLTLPLPEDNPATAIFLFGDTVLVSSETGLICADLTERFPSYSAIELNSPEDISSLSTDGVYLYAKSDFGFLTVYDENFVPVYDNVKNKYFAGKPVVAPENGLLRVFFTDSGVPYYTSFDLSGEYTFETLPAPDGITSAVSADLLFALRNGILTALDKVSALPVFSTELSPEYFTAFGREVFIVENNIFKQYKLSDDNTSLVYEATLGMTGDDDGHLNGPGDIAVYDGRKIIADTLNDRLLTITDSGISSMPVPSPKSVTVGNGAVYVANDNTVYAITDYGETTEFAFDQKIIGLTYLDALYALTQNGIYTLAKGNFIKFTDTADTKAIAAAEDGNYIYALTDDGVSMFSVDADSSLIIHCRLDGATDMQIDYAGNVFILFPDRIEKYKNDAASLTLVENYPLSKDGISSTATSFSVDDRAYFLTKESFLGSESVDFISKNEYILGEKPHISTVFSSKFYRLKTEKTVIFPVSGRTDDYSIYNSSSPVFGFSDIKDNLGRVYGVYLSDFKMSENYSENALNSAENVSKCRFGYIDLDDFEEINPIPINKSYVAAADASLYPYPGAEEVIIPPENAKISVLDNAAEFDNGKWLRAEYKGTVYFVRAEDVKPYVEIVPDVEKEYGTSKAARAGGTVKIYAIASLTSAVLAEIPDGVKVEILSHENGFYLIIYGDTVGYITENEIQLSGLTTVQLIAIILSVVVILVGAIIFFIVYRAKRISEKSDDGISK